MLDVNKLADAVVAGSKAYVDRALGGIIERLSLLEKRVPEVGAKGEQGEVGRPGADGTGVADALLGIDGNLVLTLSSGETKRLGVVIGKDGAAGRDGVDGQAGADGTPGRDGIDGIGFDDLDLIYDGAKGFRFKWSRGDKVVERHFSIPVVTYRGTFKSGDKYTPGDMVTWGGSVWHCDEPTDAKPDSVDQKSWTLAVKRGQNGKDGSDGQRGMDGKPGAPGKDLTQMGLDGSKW